VQTEQLISRFMTFLISIIPVSKFHFDVRESTSSQRYVSWNNNNFAENSREIFPLFDCFIRAQLIHRSSKSEADYLALLKCFSNSFLQVVAWSVVLIRTPFYHISRIARLMSAIKTATMMKYMTGCCRFTIDGAIIVNR